MWAPQVRSGASTAPSAREWKPKQPGTLVIEASTNLADWWPLFTNTTPTNLVFFTDPDAANYARRFYRAIWTP